MIHTILWAFLTFSPATTLSGVAPAATPVIDTTLSATVLADRIIDEACQYLGAPYRYGAGGPKAFDCSGFSSFIFRQFGYRLSHSSKGQAGEGREVEGPLSNLQRGDLVIFGARRNKKDVGHVGIVVDVNDSGTNFRFIHAARGGVMISELQEEYYRDRYLGARRILDDFEGKRSTWTSSPKVAASAEEPSGIPVDIEHPDYFDGTLVAAVDTLLLSSGDSRILLFGDGTWVYLAKDGTLIAPSSEDRLILDGNGRWRRETPKKIPPQPRPRTETASTGTAPQASNAWEDRGNTSEDTDAQYYTIRKGDTLASIASRYHTSVERLCQLNGITRRTTLHIGRRLRVR